MSRYDSARDILIAEFVRGPLEPQAHRLRAAHYGAAKAGVIGLTRAMPTELAEHGVTVNALAPGPVMTPLLREAWSPEELAARHEQVPARRLREIEEITSACLFLLAQDAGYVNGVVLPVDGGATAAGPYMAELYRRRSRAGG